MRSVGLTLLLVLALGARAQEVSDFRDTARLTPRGHDALQRFALPFDVYRDAQPGLADVRVFNAKGEPVPIARASGPERPREPAKTVALPYFPVTRLAPPGQSAAQVTVRTGDGTLVAIGGTAKAGEAAAPVAYLVDASGVKEPLAALVFDWDPAAAPVVRVTVDASDDLQHWRSSVASGSVVRLEHDGRSLVQARVPTHGLRAKYLRVTWLGRGFPVQRIVAELAGRQPLPLSGVLVAQGVKGGKPGEFRFAPGARVPVETVRVVVPGDNWVARFDIATRDSAVDPWRPVASGTFYRLVRDGLVLEAPPVEVAVQAGREWRVRVDPDTAGIGRVLPVLELGWRPAQAVFVARGEGPFTLAFGNAEARPAWVPIALLVPGYEQGAERALPRADVGPVHAALVPESIWPEWLAALGPRRMLLWAVLVLGVGFLGFMAWRLLRQARA